LPRTPTRDGLLLGYAGFDEETIDDCALAARRELRRLGLPIRSGLHTGELELMGEISAALPFISRQGCSRKLQPMRCGRRERSRTS
jgi:hypothetical protein